MPNLADVQTIASEMTDRTVVLSSMTTAVLFSALDAANRLFDWQGADFKLSADEIDQIKAALAVARYELMTRQIGEIKAIAAAVAPAGCLLCDGSEFNRVDYPDLYAILAPAYIVDADKFTVPDLSNRFILGAMTGLDVGASGGAAEHMLSIDELPAHNHSEASFGVGLAVAPGELPVSTPSLFPTTTGSTGGGSPHPNMPPFQTLLYCIVAR
jgi:microcystin-dependent protein